MLNLFTLDESEDFVFFITIAMVLKNYIFVSGPTFWVLVSSYQTQIENAHCKLICACRKKTLMQKL